MVTCALTWPEDKAFQTFARKVADGALWAKLTKQTISEFRSGPTCMCPLGAAIVKDNPRASHHPGAVHFITMLARRVPLWDSDTVLPDERMVWAFIAGFEEGQVSASRVPAVEASGRLGIEYRRRFLRKGEERYTDRTRRQRQKPGTKRVRP